MAFMEKLHEETNKGAECVKKHVLELEKFSIETERVFQKAMKDLEEFRRTGKVPIFEDVIAYSRQDPSVQVKKEIQSPVKPTRKALRETQANKKVSEPKSIEQSVKVKKEKITNVLPKRESVENMPPPADSLVLKKTIKTENMRSTRTRTRKQKELEEQKEQRKDSDVIIQDRSIVTIDLSSDEEKPQKKERSTRTKTKAAAKQAEVSAESTKRSRSASEDSNKAKSTRTKKAKKKKTNEEKEEESIYVDAVDSCDQPKPQEVVANNDLNITHVKLDSNLKDIMTDDESPLACDKTTVVVKSKTTKPLFSAFDHSPVKKKVEAFEKLKAAANPAPRQTRKAVKAQEKDNNEARETATDGAKPKSKLHTPLGTSRLVPMHFSTTVSKLKKPSLTECSPLPKARSAIKASAAEFRERELKRQREAEAIQKREALVQAQLEEKRRIRAEKQLKAQQAREAMEKEKQKHLEMMEKLKEVKLKQHLAEKDMKMQKQKEELEKKRLLAKQRAADQQAIYMISKAPLLPTPDCYDSDSEETHAKKVVLPEWNSDKAMKHQLKIQHYILPQLKNTLFCVTAQTIDLTEIFPGIDPRKLKRTSSAVWTKPPRFTFMPGLNNSLDVTKEED